MGFIDISCSHFMQVKLLRLVTSGVLLRGGNIQGQMGWKSQGKLKGEWMLGGTV